MHIPTDTRGWMTYDGGSTGIAVAVAFDRYTFDRPSYYWLIADASTDTVLAAGDDLCGGTNAEIDLADMLRTLVSFLAAAVESFPDGENAALFPAALLEMVDSSAVDMLALDLAGPDAD